MTRVDVPGGRLMVLWDEHQVETAFSEADNNIDPRVKLRVRTDEDAKDVAYAHEYVILTATQSGSCSATTAVQVREWRFP